MAALAGVAQSTVSYVMSGSRPISQKTRDKVEKAMRELGYVPDVHARAMISNRSHIIGLLTETTETTQGAELFPILRAIRATAKEHGYDLILMSSTGTTEDLADMRRLGKGNLVDAFIMLDIRHHDGRLKSAMKLGLPIVPYGDHEFPFINIFDRESIICAERHGIQLERFEAKDTRWQSFEPRTLAWIEQMMLLTGVTPGKDIGLIGEGGRGRHRADRRQGIRARRRTHAAEIHPPRDHDSRIRGLRPHKGMRPLPQATSGNGAISLTVANAPPGRIIPKLRVEIVDIYDSPCQIAVLGPESGDLTRGIADNDNFNP